MQETIGSQPEHVAGSKPRTALGAALIPTGIIAMLAGLAGDLLASTLDPGSVADGRLISFTHPNVWHLLMFAGVIVTAVGGIRWAVRERSELAGLVGGLMSLLLIATVALGGWAAMRTSNAAETRSAPPAIVPVIHNHSHGTAVTGEGDAVFGEHSHGAPGPVSAAQRVILDRQLAEAKAATAKYQDIDAAKADGYFQVTQFIPGLGLHMANLRIPKNTFDPAKPQILLYQPASDGSMQLVGVAYQFDHTTDTPPVGFAGGSDVWHYHSNLCFQRGGSVTIAGDEAACKAVGGLVFQKQTSWLLHAWVWKTNPDGVFTEVNPKVA